MGRPTVLWLPWSIRGAVVLTLEDYLELQGSASVGRGLLNCPPRLQGLQQKLITFFLQRGAVLQLSQTL